MDRTRTTWAWRLIVVVLGMSGLRLDRRARMPLRIALFATAAALYYLAMPLLQTRSGALWYAAVVWVAYYGGLSFVLGGPGRRRLIARYGEERGYAVHEIVLGLAFFHQGCAHAVVMTAYGNTLPAPVWLTGTLGVLLIAAGLGCKVWAAWTAGLDVYYCRDMFLGRAGAFAAAGPYRFVRNPMYGIGTLHAYGLALWSRSAEGLVLTLAFQLSIYLFYYAFERPFIRRAYLAPTG